MKISILDGELLDYWVARAAGFVPIYDAEGPEGSRVFISCYRDRGKLVTVPLRVFNPSADWAHAGPIIESEQIDLACDFGVWTARHIKKLTYCRSTQSPLVAAMRAYLMWKYDDEVPNQQPPVS